MPESIHLQPLEIRRRRREVWQNPAMYTTALLVAYLDTFGIEGLEWLPETIQIEIESLTGEEIPATNFEKLMVGISLMTTDAFFVSLPDFAHFCCIMSGDTTPPNTLILPSVEDIAWGITEALLISPPEPGSTELFYPEITAFVDFMLRQEGFIKVPESIRLGTTDDAAVLANIQTEFSDDPVMFSAIYKIALTKADEVDRLVRQRFHGLIRQVARLPLSRVPSERIAKLGQKILSQLPPDKPVDLPV